LAQAQGRSSLLVSEGDVPHAKLMSLLPQAFVVAVGGKGYHPNAVGQARYHIQTLCANRASASENGYPLHPSSRMPPNFRTRCW
jgi:hypothetical protein